MASVSEITKQFIALQHTDLQDEISAFHKISVLGHELAVEIRRLAVSGVEKDIIIHELYDVRKIISKSTLLSRLQKWPRGYQGDFETIEYICNGINLSTPGTIEFFLEKIVLSSAIVQQHSHKIFWQAQQILNTINANKNDDMILSIACGGCKDLRLIESSLMNMEARIVINDIDKDAIEFSKNHLNTAWDFITPIHGDSFRKANIMSKHGPYSLIIAGGLFDYLPDRYACKLLKKLSTMLADNGKICFTNILKPNPFYVWTNYLVDWNLIERTKDDFQEMFDLYELSELNINMVNDVTSLSGLYEITRI